MRLIKLIVIVSIQILIEIGENALIEVVRIRGYPLIQPRTLGADERTSSL
ncbi:uncharacterized protein METZ01_LOCUS234203, partial [marine metagenome]